MATGHRVHKQRRPDCSMPCRFLRSLPRSRRPCWMSCQSSTKATRATRWTRTSTCTHVHNLFLIHDVHFLERWDPELRVFPASAGQLTVSSCRPSTLRLSSRRVNILLFAAVGRRQTKRKQKVPCLIQWGSPAASQAQQRRNSAAKRCPTRAAAAPCSSLSQHSRRWTQQKASIHQLFATSQAFKLKSLMTSTLLLYSSSWSQEQQARALNFPVCPSLCRHVRETASFSPLFAASCWKDAALLPVQTVALLLFCRFVQNVEQFF